MQQANLNPALPILEIKDLKAGIEGKQILNGINLVIYPGELHAIMGPNGSGKSTLAAIIAGKPEYKVYSGTIRYCGRNLLDFTPEQRAREGIFLAFQHPVEIPGVNTSYFLKSALNEIRKHRGLTELDAIEFMKILREKLQMLNLPDEFLKRALNVGFSGGEKKKNEILQMVVLEPTLALLDEIDSGLDIDSLKIVANGIEQLRGPTRAQLIITHYPRLLNHVVPDKVHILFGGRIVRSGNWELAIEVENRGYEWIAKEASVFT